MNCIKAAKTCENRPADIQSAWSVANSDSDAEPPEGARYLQPQEPLALAAGEPQRYQKCHQTSAKLLTFFASHRFSNGLCIPSSDWHLQVNR